MIPILDLTRQYQALAPQLEQALLSVAAKGQYILGPQVQAFEKAAAEYLGVRHAIGVANGSDSLFLALRALEIGPGDEVITTPFTYIATSESIVRAGATPVFVDIDADTFNLDVTQLEQAITPQTKAIMPVHLFGQPARMDVIESVAQAHGLKIVEDCAQAIGAQWRPDVAPARRVGSIGDLGSFSFFPSKNLGAFGDGGLVTTNDDTLAERVRMLRVHGSRQRYLHELAGINSRLDELQAAILNVKLPHLDSWNAARQAVAARYTELLAPLGEWLTPPMVAPHGTHVFHQYTVRLSPEAPVGRDTIIERLTAAGIQTMIYYPVPLYWQPTHAGLELDPDDYPVCEAVSSQVFSLPMFPELTEAEQAQIVDALQAALLPALV